MRIPRGRAAMIVIGALAVTIAIDTVTGPEVNLVVFYLAITCFASWCIGERTGLMVVAVGVFMLGEINSFGMHSHGARMDPGVLAWNMLGRAMSMTIMVALASGLRHSLDIARWSAATDPLTGALNKAAFRRRLPGLVSQAQRRGEALVMAYVDLDGFKGVNDGFGHAAGDTLLTTFARNASETVRAHDLFARIGGDEFVALLTVPTCAQGDIAADRLHDRLSRILRGTGHKVTCSMGAMVVEATQIASAERLVEAADALMYEVKRSGKNGLRIARLDLQPNAPKESLAFLPDRRNHSSTAMADAA
jgi:diguanylate cyclase (GGDEF)-like protein